MTELTFRGNDGCPLYATIIDSADRPAAIREGALVVLDVLNADEHQGFDPIGMGNGSAQCDGRSESRTAHDGAMHS